MNTKFHLHPSFLVLLSRLWLHEPDADTIARAAHELGLPAAEPADLAPAYADLLLLNVPPYGTVFTDSSGEMNGPAAQEAAALYETHDYQPPELYEVGAPDHLGLCLGFLVHLREHGVETGGFLSDLLAWAPVCCLAIEREPVAHPFYRALAARTREWLMADGRSPIAHGEGRPLAPPPSSLLLYPSDDEVRLRDVVRFFLAPAQCGIFLSRSRWGQMANALRMRLPFGSRLDVAEMVFRIAGESERVTDLLHVLSEEIEQWAVVYRAWSTECTAWQPFAVQWLERIDSVRRTLAGMREILARPLELESEVHDAARV